MRRKHNAWASTPLELCSTDLHRLLNVDILGQIWPNYNDISRGICICVHCEHTSVGTVGNIWNFTKGLMVLRSVVRQISQVLCTLLSYHVDSFFRISCQNCNLPFWSLNHTKCKLNWLFSNKSFKSAVTLKSSGHNFLVLCHFRSSDIRCKVEFLRAGVKNERVTLNLFIFTGSFRLPSLDLSFFNALFCFKVACCCFKFKPCSNCSLEDVNDESSAVRGYKYKIFVRIEDHCCPLLLSEESRNEWL